MSQFNSCFGLYISGEAILSIILAAVVSSANGQTSMLRTIAENSSAKASSGSTGVAVPSSAGVSTMTTTVNVTTAPEIVDAIEGYERKISSREIESSAGTFGDPTRFLQMLPGVVSDNDERNDAIVRGGNPSETLFVIDNLEIPSINQLALSDTTGGFVSMIDNTAVTHFTLHTDTYDDKFDQRLSGVMEMSTLPDNSVERHTQSEFGIGGGLPGEFCTSCNDRNWSKRSWTWHEGRSMELSRW